MKKYYILLLVSILTLGACNTSEKKQTETAQKELSEVQVTPLYAKGFAVSYQNGMCLVDMQDPENGKELDYHFAFVPRGTEAEIPEGYTRIDTPVRSSLCMTTLQLSNFIKMDRLDAVVGVTSTKHLFNKEVKEKIKKDEIHKIGIEGNFDNEIVMAINPDVILISPFKRGGYDALMNVGIPLIPHLGYKELTPLGQAEWIKFIGIMLGEEEKANALFASMEKNYKELQELAANVENRPTVFSGELHGGNWYVVGGKSFLAQIFKDAGADYVFKDDESTGGVNMDYEVVYAKAAKAQYWRLLNSFDGDYTYQDLKAADARYADFDAWKNQGVIYSNMSQTPYYESMPVEPDKLLSDFIKVFHPELLPDYVPTFYSLLK